MVGYAFMGAVHSQAWRNAHRFFDLPLTPELTALSGRNESAVRAAAHRLGWMSVESNWRRLVERDDIGLIDICTPGDTHAEIAIAALEAGKHVMCKKPLANSVSQAEQMAAAADKAALSDENSPLTWRMDKERAGSEVNGSLGSIAFDLEDMNTLQFYDGTDVRANRASAASWSPNPSIPTSPTGGRLGTGSATSMVSSTRWSIWSRRSAEVSGRGRPSPTRSGSSRCLPRSRPAPANSRTGRARAVSS